MVFPLSVVDCGWVVKTEDVWREEEEAGKDAIEEGDDEEQQEEFGENDELRSTVSARSFTGFSGFSVLNSVQSKVLERPSRLRSRTLLLRGSGGGEDALLQLVGLLISVLGASEVGLGSEIGCEHGSSVTWAFRFSSGRDLGFRTDSFREMFFRVTSGAIVGRAFFMMA